ncbi:MAG TPA: hypothetical protein VK680_09870 [Solirubrobacteraceae bacterium]|jgi:hypothetical protein|nr:hypothetical protein [Solirubrobacteraceae bacterium]
MDNAARFPHAGLRAGMYESFYLRAVSPHDPVGIWIRHTVHKPPGRPPRGSLWCTVFDARRGRPFMHKLTTDELSVPADGWITVGESSMGPARADGSCGAASWSLRFACEQDELCHLSPSWLYRTPLPRTKLTTPLPLASFDGVLQLAEREPIELAGWPGMVGHNWGSEHAERWIWLHGVAFADAPGAWLDVALARLKLAGRMTPWIASGALCVDGQRHRLGGLGARGTVVHESADGCTLELGGSGGLKLQARFGVPPQSAAGWRYSDPSGHAPANEHDVANCSVAAVELTVSSRSGTPPKTLRSDHGGVYELGMRERDHGVPIAPFGD